MLWLGRSVRGALALPLAASRAAWLAASMGSFICGDVPCLVGGGGGAGENGNRTVIAAVVAGDSLDYAPHDDAGGRIAGSAALTV